MLRHVRTSAFAAVLLSALMVLGGVPTASASAPKAGGLGPKDKASGTPIKIGYLLDGENPTTDGRPEFLMAQAAEKFFNDYRGGIGGKPLDLVICQAKLDPALTTDCANQMVQQGVAAVVMGGLSNQEVAYQALKAAGIPTLWTATNLASVAADADGSFMFFNSGAALYDLPKAVAKANKAKKISVFIVDVPSARGSYSDAVVQEQFKKQGYDVKVVPVPLNQADFTGVPEIRELAGKSDVETHFVAFDAFCIGAFKALQAINYTGPKSSNASCLSEATKSAIPASFLEGLALVANAPYGNDKSAKLLNKMAKKYDPSIDTSQITVGTGFLVLNAMDVALDTIKGSVTPATVKQALHDMPWTELPFGAGLHFRCNGQAVPERPALCVRGALKASVDESGNLSGFEAIGDTKIEDAGGTTATTSAAK